MNTCPGIYKALDGTIYYYLNKVNFFSPERNRWEEDCDNDDHKADKNITREYLANTYGEVESKEHAEFVVKLAEGAGFKLDNNGVSMSSVKSFMIYGDEKLIVIYTMKAGHLSNDESYKEITIPLPPKEPEPKEWPQVGEDVAWSPKLSRKGTLLNIYEGMAWIKDSYGEFVSIEVNKLKKPLTPEEELAKELEKMVYEGMDNSYDLNHNCYYLVSGLMKKYDIKKKPE